MVSLSSALQTATSGLNVSQVGLSTISHNLANANTDGFTRQDVRFSNVSSNGFGAGVQLEDIQRVADRFLTERALTSQADVSYNETRTSFLNSLEGILSTSGTSGGLNVQLNTFFASLGQLANTPDSAAQQTIVVQNATLLTDSLRSISNSLTTVANNVDERINEEVNTVNRILENIDNLNQQISAQGLSGVGGASANDLQDERQRQVDALSERFNITVTDNTTNGALRISTEDGRTLVQETSYAQLERTAGTPFGGLGLRSITVNGGLSNTLIPVNSGDLTTGSVKALIDVRDTIVGDLSAEINNLANTVRNDFNAVHSLGSSTPARATLSSANTAGVTNATSDLFTELDPNLAGSTFNISVVDLNGNAVQTTIGNGGPVTIPGVGPFSLTDLQDLVNNNADVGVTALGLGLGVTATATANAAGEPTISFTASNSNLRIVLSSDNVTATNNPLAVLGTNNFFTGTSAADINVRSDIRSDPNLIATARVRPTDGGLSSFDNQNALALAALSDSSTTFNAAGSLAGQDDSLSEYAVRITSNLALITADSQSRTDFSESLLQEVDAQIASLTEVNIDEELAELLIFQTAFQASARIISTIDEMFQILFQNV